MVPMYPFRSNSVDGMTWDLGGGLHSRPASPGLPQCLVRIKQQTTNMEFINGRLHCL